LSAGRDAAAPEQGLDFRTPANPVPRLFCRGCAINQSRVWLLVCAKGHVSEGYSEEARDSLIAFLIRVMSLMKAIDVPPRQPEESSLNSLFPPALVFY
jgi:hypothetical protein